MIQDDLVDDLDRPNAEASVADPSPLEASADEAASDVRVGRRIRALRLEHGLSLAETAARAGLSVGTLSQIERGLSSLRVRSLWPLAAALGVEPHTLVDKDETQSNDLYVVREGGRKSVPVHSEGISKELLSPPGAVLTGLRVVVEPGGGTGPGPYSHDGHEFGCVLTGEIELTIDSILYRLKAGDSFAFKSTLPHAFRNLGSQRCEILWINTAKPTEVKNGA